MSRTARENIVLEGDHSPRRYKGRRESELNTVQDYANAILGALDINGPTLWTEIRREWARGNRQTCYAARDVLESNKLIEATTLSNRGFQYRLIRFPSRGEVLFPPDPKRTKTFHKADPELFYNCCSRCGTLKNGPELVPGGTSKGLWRDEQAAVKAFAAHVKEKHVD